MNKLDFFARLSTRLMTVQRSLPAGCRPVLLLPEAESRDHPFEERNIHPKLPGVVKQLYDNTHYSQASFEAFKYLDKVVQYLSGSNEFGVKLMHKAFGKEYLIKLNDLKSESSKTEQEGYQFLFAGSVLAIRNPRGHEHSVDDTPDGCLDHLGFASMLLRRLEDAGLIISDGND